MTKHVLFIKHDNKRTYNSTARSGSETGPVIAELTYRKSREQGELILSDPEKKYQVKHEMISGRWDLSFTSESVEEEAMITVKKPKWESRRVLMTMGDETFLMTTKSRLRDHYSVLRLESFADAEAEKGTEVATMEKTFSRSLYTVKYSDGVPVELPLFCYWIANLFLRREMRGF